MQPSNFNTMPNKASTPTTARQERVKALTQLLDFGFPVEYTLTEVATKFGDDDLTLADLIGTQAH